MINNSTNITWLNTKNSDDQQFHQHHLIEHKKQWWSTIPPTSPDWTQKTVMINNSTNVTWLNTKKRPRHMTLEIQDLAWDRHIHVTGLNRIMGWHLPLRDNWIFNGNTYINNLKMLYFEKNWPSWKINPW